MPPKFIVGVIPIDIYRRELVFSCGQDHIKLAKLYNKVFPGSELTIATLQDGGFSVSDITKNMLLWIKHRPRNPKTYSVLAHESTHAAIEILTRAGIKLVDESDEAYAYLVQHIMREALYITNRCR